MPSPPATAEVGSPSFETLQQLVAQFSAYGGRTAVAWFRNEAVDELSYAQLASAIVRTARSLHARGIGAGDRVALWAPNSPDWIIAYFGIVCAGAAAVPLDQQSTAETAVAALTHATPRLLITTLAHRRELEQHGAPMIDSLLIDGGDAEGLAALPSENVATELPRLAPTAIASLLFTSGTTGTPKAVPLTHANLAANTRELAAADLIGRNERLLLPLPLHHTYPFTVGLLAPLALGAAVILPAGISGPEITHAASLGRATALLAVPRLCVALWDSVVAGANARGAVAAFVFRTSLALSIAVRRATGMRVGKWLFRPVHARLGRALDVIGCGGAKLPVEIARNLEGLGWTVLTGYGLTETSPVLTFNSRQHARLGSEGRPLRGVELRIAAAASDTPGEILARGPSVFTGYWHDAAATAATFTADGWFKTGDLGQLDEQDYLHVVGRSKELIVLSDGKKFFPETVEKLYAQAATLREIGVFERGGRLAAVAVPNEEAARARGALREVAWLREALDDIASRLPPYQRITSYRFVREPLPRTQLGKLRRHLLPALFEGTAQEKTTNDAAPWSAADRRLVDSPRGGAVWQWLIERYPDRSLTLDTSPQLDLEIDSLEWVALTVEIERRFSVALRSDQLGNILTLRDLLREIESAPRAGASIAPAQPAFVPPGPIARTLGAVVFGALRLAVRATLSLRVHGLEHLPAGPALITPNHASYLDPLVLAAALPWRRLRRTYWAGWVGVMHSSRLRRWLSHATQVFPVDPDRDLTAALRTARALLEQGHTVVWFPEGRRSPTGDLGQFQSGVGTLLAETTAPAVPVAIGGTYAAWPKHRRWPHAAPTSVTFGAPLTFAAHATARDIRATLERAVAVLLTPPPKSPTPFHDPEQRKGEPAMASTNTVTATLSNGRRVTIRPIRHDDITRNTAFLEGLSAQSKHSLFLGGIAQLSDTTLQRLCDPDDAHDMAYVALAEDPAAGQERQVGVCRYAGGADAGAEISVAVADDWQHQGLGKLLLRHLIAYAGAHGVRRLFSMDAVNNEPMRRLARDVGFRESPDPDDIHQVIYSLQPEQS